MIWASAKQVSPAVEIAKAIVFFAAGVAAFYYFVVREVPEIRAAIGRIEAQIERSEKRQQAEISKQANETRRHLERVDGSLAALRSHVVALKFRVEGSVKANEIKDLVSSVNDIGVLEAAKFSSYSVVSGSPIPKVPGAITKAPGYLDMWRVEQGQMYPAFAKADLGKYLTLLLFAKNGDWQATREGLKVSYDGGSALLKAKGTVSLEELQEQAELFNSLSSAVQVVGKNTWQPAFEVKPGNSPKPDSRAPSMSPLPSVPDRTQSTTPGQPTPLPSIRDRSELPPGKLK